MVRKQILKRASYIGAALILMLAAVPIIPVQAAPTDHCATRLYGGWTGGLFNARYEDGLDDYLSDYREGSLCADLSNYSFAGRKQTFDISSSATLDLNGHILTSNVQANGRNVVIVGDGMIDGNLDTAWGGTFTIYGGTYTSNPTRYVADGYYAKRENGRWVVLQETKVETKDVIIPVGGAAELFTVTPAGGSTYIATDEAGNDVSDTAVRVSTSTDGGVTTGTITGVEAGEYNVRVTTDSGDKDTARVKVFDYNRVSDMVLPKGGSQNIGLTTTGADVGWEVVNSSDAAVATVENGVVNALASGKTTMTVRFADTLGTTFTFDVYVYDFDATDNVPLLIKKGGSAIVNTDSYWNVTASANNEVAETVAGSEGKFTIGGLGVGETEFTFNSVVNGRELSKTVKVYVYDVEEDEIWVNKGETINYTGIKLNSDDVEVEVSSADAGVANTTTTVYDIEGVAAGDTTLTYKLKVATRIVEIPVTVHVYNVNAKTSATIVEGTEVALANAAIAEIENTDAITVRIADGDEYIAVDGKASGNLTTVAKGTAKIEFYAGEKKVGETEIKVYALQDLQDIVLSITGTGANLSEVVEKLEDVNLPEYRINVADSSVARVREEGYWTGFGWGRTWNVSGHRISARGAGKTTATVTYIDSLGETTQTFDVLVSDYATRNVRGNHDTAQGGEVKFMISELYDQDSVSYEDDLGFDISRDERGEYIVKVPADMAGGEYTLKFTDKVGDVEIAKQDVVIRVHEIAVSEDELYIKKDGEAGKVIVNEANGFAPICENVWHTDYWFIIPIGGHYEYECNIEIADASGAASDGITVNATEGSDEYEIVVNEAGEYTVTFSDGVASKTITVYAIDFTVDKTEYHLVKGDNAPRLIKAINKYWNETAKESGVSGFKVTKDTDTDTDYYFWPTDAEAGKYTVTFYAKIGDKIVDQKVVEIYLYEMVAPQENLYFAQPGDQLTITVDDLNEAAYTNAEIVGGPEGGLEFEQDSVGKINVKLPGAYTVQYTDYMKDGGIVGVYEATIVVIEVEYEEVFVRRGETITLNGNSAWDASFAVDGMTGEDYKVENGEIVYDTTDMYLGEHIVEIAHDFSEFDDGEFPPRETVKIMSVVVWDVTGDEADDMDADGDRASVVEFVAEKIAGMIENDSTADSQIAIDGDIDYLKDALRDGVDIMTRLEVRLLDESEWEYAEAYDKVMLKIKDENGVVAMYEAYLVIYAGDEEIGLVYELDNPITMRLAIPEEYATAPDGYTRTFYVMRGHMTMDSTESAERIEVTRDGNDLVFLNNKFSSFAVVYTDKLIPPVAPDTGFVVSENSSASTSNLVAAIATLIGALILAGAAVFAKRK